MSKKSKPTKRQVETFLSELTEKDVDRAEWDVKLMDTYLYYYPHLYLKFVSSYEQRRRVK